MHTPVVDPSRAVQAVEGTERVEIAEVVAGEGHDVEPAASSSTTSPLFIGTGGCSSATIFPGCSSRPASAAASAAQAPARSSSSGRLAPVQGHRDPVLALHQHPGQVVGGGDGDRLHRGPERLDPGIGDHLTVDPSLQPVLADVGDPVDAERVTQERDRPSTHDRDERDLTDERRAARPALRGARPPVGVVDDQRERAVEVDEHRGPAGMLGQRTRARRARRGRATCRG